ncbi:unnamed protein product, partial [Scytosiphon promiscuus]
LVNQEFFKLYDQPKVPQLEATLLKRITEDEARHILFLPDHDQARYYQGLIADPPKGAPAEHPQHSLQVPHLSLLYLQHWKRWDFVSSFVLAGGLHTLCSLFTHANPVVRMKAITTLVSITAHRDFDWFSPLPRVRPVSADEDKTGGSTYANNTTEARLHRALLGLRLDPAFISGLIANSWGGGARGGGSSGGGKKTTEDDVVASGEKEGEGFGWRGEGKTFPGGCLMCLELLAMWLSWVRALHTVDGTLRLSRPLFRAIKEWGGKDDDRKGERGSGRGPCAATVPHKKEKPLPPVREDARAAGMVPEEGGMTDGSGVGNGEEGDREGERETEQVADTAAVATVDGQGGVVHSGERDEGETVPSDEGSEAQRAAVMARAESEERAKVLELSEKLVADFGRFPPAEQEWEGVEEGKQTGKGRAPVKGRDDAVPASRAISDEEEKTAGQGVGEISGDGGSSRCETAQTVGDAAPSATPTQRALALKLEGNDSFRKADLYAARDAYTTALGVLAGEVAGDGRESKTKTTEKPEAREAEAAVLRGVLHRNRAAVALRLRYTPPNHGPREPKTQDARNRARDGEKAAAGGTDLHPEQPTTPAAPETEPVAPKGERGTSTSNPKEGWLLEETSNNERAALESSLALLNGCESDCLQAIEVDASDKKARLRLDRCRALRRRCCRGGLAAAVEGKERYPIGHSRQDERLQERKADLVAKILARRKGSHELLSETDDGEEEATHAAAADVDASDPTADEEGSDRASGPSSGGEGRTSVLADDDCARAGSSLGVDGDSSGGKNMEQEASSAAAEIEDKGSASCVTDRDGANPAPREGSELRRAVGRRSWGGTDPKTAGPIAPSSSAASTAGEHEDNKEGFSATTSLSPKGTDRGGAILSAGVGRPKESAVSKKKNKKGGDGRDPEALRSLRRSLERAIARMSAPGGGTSGVGDERVSLRRLFGDGVTAEAVSGIALGLKHACRIDPPANTERATQLFSELARVKRVRLALAMCSAEDRRHLQDVWNHILRSHYANPE